MCDSKIVVMSQQRHPIPTSAECEDGWMVEGILEQLFHHHEDKYESMYSTMEEYKYAKFK